MPLTLGPALESRVAGPGPQNVPFHRCSPQRASKPAFFPCDAAPPRRERGNAGRLGGTSGRGPAQERARACAPARLGPELGSIGFRPAYAYSSISQTSGAALGPFFKSPVALGRKGPRTGSDGEGELWNLRLQSSMVRTSGSKPLQRLSPQGVQQVFVVTPLSSSTKCAVLLGQWK